MRRTGRSKASQSRGSCRSNLRSSWRGGILTMSRRTCRSRTACSFAAISSMCQLGRNAGIQFGEATQHEGIEIHAQRRLKFGLRNKGHDAPCPNRRVNSAMTIESASLSRLASCWAGRASLAWTSASSSCVERASPDAARLTNCLTVASNLVIRRRRPFSLIAHPFAQSRRDDRAEVARALRPAARVAGLAGAKAGHHRWAAITDPFVRRLSAIMKAHFWASERCSSRMVGTSLHPRRLHASRRPCPAITFRSRSIKSGTLNPKLSMLWAICRICFALCWRVLRVAFQLIDRKIRDRQ